MERIPVRKFLLSEKRRKKNYSFSIQSGLECVCMFVSWRGDLLRSSAARVFFSKFIDVYIQAVPAAESLLGSLSLFCFFFFRANTAKKAGRQRRLLGGHYCCRYPSFYWLRYSQRWAELWRAEEGELRHQRGTPFWLFSPHVKGVLKGRIEKQAYRYFFDSSITLYVILLCAMESGRL